MLQVGPFLFGDLYLQFYKGQGCPCTFFLFFFISAALSIDQYQYWADTISAWGIHALIICFIVWNDRKRLDEVIFQSIMLTSGMRTMNPFDNHQTCMDFKQNRIKTKSFNEFSNVKAGKHIPILILLLISDCET